MSDESEDSEPSVREEDIFGLPKMSTNMEIGISFTLFILGMLMVFSVIYSVNDLVDIGPGLLGMLMLGVSYLFAIEAIRELEEKDHFLSRKLMSR
ncbi:hypothetical protein HRED_00753 [Candidatus Haloredivivus sp. G17]|jgi:hypothetical protein|nr:hypothetical protein HRED_00753 [Candidatus Haloredivivus sp. G17]